jgi:hypothetical protein
MMCQQCKNVKRVDVGYYCVYHCTIHRDTIVVIVDTLFNETEYLNKPCEEVKQNEQKISE